MEDKLMELKQEWCKWKCPHFKKSVFNEVSKYCPEHNDYFCKYEDEYYSCEHCQVEEFIKFIRDELN